MGRIIGIIILLVDVWWVYSLGLASAFSNFGDAIAIVVLAVLGAILIAKK